MLTYRVQKGDTLETVANRLGLTIFELRNYHNLHCELWQLIGRELTPKINYILYEPREKTAEKKFSEFDTGSEIRLDHFPDDKPLLYGVRMVFAEQEKENQLSYELQMEWKERNRVQIRRENIYIDEKEPNYLADELAVCTASVLYPLELTINARGEISGMGNLPEIQKRWTDCESRIRSRYRGALTETYLAKNRYILSQPHVLTEELNRDVFLHSFFCGLYGSYPAAMPRNDAERFPLLAGKPPVDFECRSRLLKYREADDCFLKVEREGSCCDTRSLSDIEAGRMGSEETAETSLPVQGSFRGLYFLNPERYFIEDLWVECSLEGEKSRKVSVSASLLTPTRKLRDQPKQEEGKLWEIGRSSAPGPKNSFLFD